MFDKRQVTLYNEVQAQYFVKFDNNRFKQIICILMQNALKFTEPNHNCYAIISVSKNTIKWNDKDYIKVSVKDNGVGIQNEEPNQILEMFDKDRKEYP